MFVRIFLALVVFALVELTLLLLLGKYVSVTFTVLFVVGTAVLGAVLLRRQSWQAWRNVQRDLDAGKLPGESLADGAMRLLASLLLIMPGVLTDVVGFSLLVPACRRWYRRVLMLWLQYRIEKRLGQLRGAARGRTEVIDSYVVTNPPEPPPSLEGGDSDKTG